jgi:hypothetical protein
VEEHGDHGLHRSGILLLELCGSLAHHPGRDFLLDLLEGVDADDTEDAAGEKKSRFDGHRAAERIAEKNDLLGPFRIDDGLDVRAELGHAPAGPAPA